MPYLYTWKDGCRRDARRGWVGAADKGRAVKEVSKPQ